MSDWKKYRRANKDTARMREPYARATLFLTYIQGGNTTEWVDRLGEWLDYQIDPLNLRRTVSTNEWLWNSVELAFNRQFADKLTQERALAELKSGIKMTGEELSDYISHFKALVRVTFSPWPYSIISSITTGLPRFFIAIPQPPHLLLLTIWRRCYLRYKDLFHCTFPSVIQGPLSLYDYIGIWCDTIYPHTPTSSTIHIGLAYVGPDHSSI